MAETALFDGQTGVFRYRAFISYAHADHKLAVWLHKALEAYRVPKKLVGQTTTVGRVPRKIGRCFRDEAELGAAHELGPKITAALQSSDVLIVVCSPRAARSKWVDQEITAFKQLGREARVFALIVDGIPHGPDAVDCFPPALKLTISGAPAEPLAVDLRKFGRGDALIRIVSGLFGIDYDTLFERERRRRRLELLRAQAIVVSGLVLTVVASVASWLAIDNSARAAENAARAADASASAFASEAEKLLDSGHLPEAMLLALYGDPAAARQNEAVRRLRPNGLEPARNALAKMFVHAPEAKLSGHTKELAYADFSPDGSRVVTAAGDGTARVWDAHTGKSLASTASVGDQLVETRFSSDGLRLLTVSYRGATDVWDAQSGKHLVDVTEQYSQDGGIARFSPDGSHVVVVQDDKESPVLKDAATGNTLAILKGHTFPVTSVAFSADGSQIATGSLDTYVRIWNGRTGQPIAKLDSDRLGERLEGSYPTFSPDGSRLVAIDPNFGAGRKAYVWDLRTGKFEGRLGYARFAAFSPDGSRMVVIDEDDYVSILDSRTRQDVANLRGSVKVNAAAFSPDGTRLVTTSEDHVVRVWNARTGELLAVLAGHGKLLASVKFSPDGSRIVSASWDMTARVWKVPDLRLKSGADLARLACARLAKLELYDFSPEKKAVMPILNGLTPPCGAPPPGKPAWPVGGVEVLANRMGTP